MKTKTVKIVKELSSIVVCILMSYGICYLLMGSFYRDIPKLNIKMVAMTAMAAVTTWLIIIAISRSVKFFYRWRHSKNDKTTNDLFYSGSDKKLFYVAGYTDNSDGVDNIIEMLQKNKNEFIKLGGRGKINTTYITKSRRYKSMRVFFCTTEKAKAPKSAFHITGNGWDMWKWLSD